MTFTYGGVALHTEGAHKDIVILSSRKLLGNAHRGVHAWNGRLPIKCDGTYKLVKNGWVFIALVTHTVRIRPVTRERGLCVASASLGPQRWARSQC